MPTFTEELMQDTNLVEAINRVKAVMESHAEDNDLSDALNTITRALGGKQDNLTFDSAPTSGSGNPVTSDGVKTALDGKQNNLTFDSTPTAGSSNPVTSDGVKNALNAVQEALIFDTEPTAGSTNPVTSNGIKAAIDAEASRASIAEASKVSKPETNPNGAQGQMLQSDGAGGTVWSDVGTPTDAQASSAIASWLNQHPEATTTVQDESITEAKLANNLRENITNSSESVSDLKSAIGELVCANLMGTKANYLYPVDIAPGGKFTVSTSDNSIFPTDSTLQVFLLDENRTQTDYFTLKNGESYRTITTNSGRARTKYLKWNESPSVPLMVVYGNIPLPYVAFFEPLNVQINKVDARVEKLEINPQNLIGMQKDKYYPVNPPIKAGESITICVANSEQLESACDVLLYDSEKTQIQSLRVYNTSRSRTVIVNSDISYIRLGMYPAKLLSIVRGTETKQYSPLAYDYNQYAACIQTADDYYKQRIKYPDYFVNNVYVSLTSHLIDESPNFVSTNPIPLNKGDVLHYNLCTNGSPLISLYDKKTGAYISSPVVGNSGGSVMTEGTYTLEQDAYVIVSHRPVGVMYDSKSYFYVNDSVFRKAYISANTSEVLSGTFVSGYGTLDGWESNAIAFSKLMIDTEKAEAFLFFTDSHFMSKTGNKWKPYIYEVFSYIEKLYYSTPCSFVLHGGDWLGTGESREDYMYKLASIGGAFRRNFDRYALVVGNHETAGQSAEHTRLTHDTLTNTLMSRFERCYYTFNANTFKMYCFDTWDSGSLDNYGQTQLKWFANALTTETAEHIVVAMHILYDEGNLSQMGEQISLCAEAYNNRGSFTYDDITYNYSNVTGKVAFIIAGHEHGDRTGTVNNIPFILTVNTTGYGGEGNFDLLPLPLDLIKVDWTNSLLTAYRARRDAAGTIRTLQIVT